MSPSIPIRMLAGWPCPNTWDGTPFWCPAGCLARTWVLDLAYSITSPIRIHVYHHEYFCMGLSAMGFHYLFLLLVSCNCFRNLLFDLIDFSWLCFPSFSTEWFSSALFLQWQVVMQYLYLYILSLSSLNCEVRNNKKKKSQLTYSYLCYRSSLKYM